MGTFYPRVIYFWLHTTTTTTTTNISTQPPPLVVGNTSTLFFVVFFFLSLSQIKYLKYLYFFFQAEITKCVVKKDLTPEHYWLFSIIESLKYFLTTIYVYIMKEAWGAKTESTWLFMIVWCEVEISDLSIKAGVEMVTVLDEDWASQHISVCCWMAVKCFISVMFVLSQCL